MKKVIGLLAVVAFVSCNSSESTDAKNSTPTAISDSSTHPSGTSNSNVISTDTSKFDVKPINQDSMEKVRKEN